MKFKEEDSVITAKEAIEKSANSMDDSLIRDGFRRIMSNIRAIAPYGYQHTCVYGNDWSGSWLKDDRKIVITKALEHLGYILHERVVDGQICMVIIWDKASPYYQHFFEGKPVDSLKFHGYGGDGYDQYNIPGLYESILKTIRQPIKS